VEITVLEERAQNRDAGNKVKCGDFEGHRTTLKSKRVELTEHDIYFSQDYPILIMI